MAKAILRKDTKGKEIPAAPRPRAPRIDAAIKSIGGAIGIASLLAASDDLEIEGTKGGTVQLVGDALLSLLDKAYDALSPND